MTLEKYILYVIMPILSLALFIVIIRFVKGPTFADRIVALDLLITIGIGFIGVYALAVGRSVFMDAAMLLALIGFLGTVAFSYYLIKVKNGE